MFTNVLHEVTDRLDSRFILTLFFPSLVFWGGLATVYAADKGLVTLLTQWRAQDAGVQLTQIIIALAWVTFFAYLLSNQLVWLTKQFEGYWKWVPFLGKRLVAARQKHYQRVLSSIDPKADYERIYYAFPFPDEPEEVMPTRLGNILKNSERYSLQRYEMDAVLLWPRLYAVLPESFTKILEGAKASLDFMLVISSLSISFALITGIYLLIVQSVWWLFLLCFLGGLLVAWAAYQSALETAITYGQLIKSAFDLYKDELRKQLGYEKPKSLEQERAFWQNIYDLIYKGEAGKPDDMKYLTDKETQASSSTETKD
jgi:hypothetical protein